MKKESYEPHLGSPGDVSDGTVPCYEVPGRYPKTRFSVENVWSGFPNGIRTLQFARERDHVHSTVGKYEYSVAASAPPGYGTLLGDLSDMVQSETSLQEVGTLLSETIRLMKSQIVAMERKLAQDRRDIEVSNVQGLPLLHMCVEMMLLKRRVDSRKETLLGMEEWRKDYVC
jgi:hypothetical protein